MRFGFGLSLLAALMLSGLPACSTNRTYTKEELEAQHRAKAKAKMEAEAQQNAEREKASKNFTDRQVGLEQEFTLRDTDKVKLDSRNLFVQLVKTGWTTVETPKGESRTGWARLLITEGDEMKQITVEEEDYGFGFGLQFHVNYAFEEYQEDISDYRPIAKIVVKRQ